MSTHLTFQFDGSTNIPHLTDTVNLAYSYETTEAAQDIATELGLDSYEVVEQGRKIATYCPRMLTIDVGFSRQLGIRN